MKLTNQEIKVAIEEGGVLKSEELAKYLLIAEKAQESLDLFLVRNNILTNDQIGELVAAKIGFPFIKLQGRSIDSAVVNLISKESALRNQIVPFEQDENSLKVATNNPYNIEFFNILQKQLKKDIVPYYATNSDIEAALSRVQKGVFSDFEKTIRESIVNAQKSQGADLPIVEILNLILNYGYDRGVSDIHLEPIEEGLVIRLRIDGILHDIVKIPETIEERLISRIKVMSKLPTDEHSSAQDGKFRFKTKLEEIDVRVSILPVVNGEKAVLRLLSSKNKSFMLEDIGIIGEDLIRVQKALSKSTGMILAVGPTGCGKTTTLYSILRIFNKRSVNISTIEDPIEYSIMGVNQVQVNAKTNLTFAQGLRSLLRQDPDILMVGEIRDEETARIAVNAALTGHLVLTTLHTNNAATTLPRLIDMEIKPYLIASTVNLVIAQRLVRKICPECIHSIKLNDAEKGLYGNAIQRFTNEKKVDDIVIYEGKGCEACGGTGFSGRVGLFEVLSLDDQIRKLIIQNAASSEISKAARASGMTLMFEDGIKKVLKGLTTLSEVVRITDLEDIS